MESIVSTKLTSEEYEKFQRICDNQNSNTSEFMKQLILQAIYDFNNITKQNLALKIEDVQQSAEKMQSKHGLDEKTVSDLIQKINKNEIDEKNLHDMYVKLGEKFQDSGLSKLEQILYRKVHQKLREKYYPTQVSRTTKNNVQKFEPAIKQETQVKPKENMSLDERFQYF